MNVVLNEHGKLNVNSLALLVPKQGSGKPPEVKIDELFVKIGKVSYQGYFPGAGVKTMEFDPNINETFHDVTDPSKVAGQIIHSIISKIGIGSFATFADEGGIKKAMDDATTGFKGLFGSK